jgi:hypothetical protein
MNVPAKWFNSVKGSAAIIAAIMLIVGSLISLSTITLANSQQRAPAIEPLDIQNLIFIWASGTLSIQQKASQICQADNISLGNCAGISAGVRSAWLDLMQVDPASLGRIGVQVNLSGRAHVYNVLAGKLSSLTQGKESLLLTQTQQALQQLNISVQQANNSLTSAARTSYAVWATSFTQNPLPDGLHPKTSPYVALPDAYLKYANWGLISNIPSIYQAYYAPNGTKTHWSVTISLPNGTSATLPSSCPVSTTLIAPNATSNRLVNGICPNGQNLRRVYYYLLYTHHGLPFFQPSGYSPSGNFTDGNWPTALPRGCSESAAASVNNDGITCGGAPNGYNANNGAWLRSGTFNTGITNQSSIDLSPAVNKALGWTYPSSGLVKVKMSALP